MPTGATTVLAPYTDGGYVPVVEALQLVIQDPDQVRAPTSVNVILTGADPDQGIAFSMDGNYIWYDTADSDGALFLVSVPIPVLDDGSTLWPPAGTYTLLVEAGAKTATADLTLARPPSQYPQVQAADVDPVEIPDRGNSWAIQDPKPGGLGSWVMPISPTSMTEPELSKVVDVDHSTSPTDGTWWLSAADNPPKTWSFSGYCPDQTFYETMDSYVQLNRRLYVIDHRGRAWKVVLLDWKPVLRKRQIDPTTGNPQDWAADYGVDALIYDTVWFDPVSP